MSELICLAFSALKITIPTFNCHYVLIYLQKRFISIDKRCSDAGINGSQVLQRQIRKLTFIVRHDWLINSYNAWNCIWVISIFYVVDMA